MRRLVFLSVLFLILLSCGKKEEGVTIQFWAFGGNTKMTKFARERVAEFNRTHPGISVVISQKSWNMIRELLYTNFSAGTGPDVMRLHANYSTEFGEAGFFYPINEFADFKEVKDWYEPNIFDATRYKDDYYGLPLGAIAFTLLCNKSLFDQEELPPPRTWSEFREVAKRLTKDTDGDGEIDQYGLVLLGGDRGGFSYRLVPFIFKAGGDILSEDFKKVEFNNPIGLSAVQLFTDMYQIDKSITPGFLAYTISEITDLFANDKVAMSIEGPWYPSVVWEKVPNKEFITVTVPVPDDRLALYDTAPTLQDIIMLAISGNSKHPKEAWEFIKFMRCPEADRNWITTDMGGIAVTKEALNSPEAEEFPNLALYRNELAHSKAWPTHPKIITIARHVICPYAQKAIVGEMGVKEAMDTAAKEAERLLAEDQ